MKLIKVFSVLFIVIILLTGFSPVTQARVMMMANVSKPLFSITPLASFTMDDWVTNPNLWTVTITNTGGDKTVTRLFLDIIISSAQYGLIADGTLGIVGPTSKYYIKELGPGQTFPVTNTMVQEGNKQYISNENWSTRFKDEASRIGGLPEGTYTLKFSLRGNYSDPTDKFNPALDDMLVTEHEIEIRNPAPPELMTPDDSTDDAVAIPRLTWQRPSLSDFSSINNTVIQIFYTIKLWKMFEEDGTILSEEDALVRVPIWSVENITTEAIDFDPGTSREDLISGRKYCWQVQALDGQGKFITQTNEGKSDAWDFTVQFTPPALNDPQSFSPLTITWSPAQAAGGQVFYRVSIDEDPDFSNPYELEGIPMTSFTYPDDAPALQRGTSYYIEVQTTDDANIPLGVPDMIAFSLPPVEVELRSPEDETVLPSKAPSFEWTGNSTHYVVTIFDEASDWTYSSTGLQDTRWMYDGDPLSPGLSYSWNVTPTNQFGDIIGDPSETRSFTLPLEDQVTLISPVNENIDTIFPVLVWNDVTSPPGERVNYNLVIMDGDGNIIHSVVVGETQYQYPQDAEMLKYGAKYSWYVGAEAGGAEVATESTPAGFVTPFVTVEGEAVSMDEISDAIKVVMSDFPEFQEFEGKILVSINGDSGPVTPEQLMDMIGKFKILKVTIE